MKISVVINTYNAEKHLERVLISAMNFDEIVICDMESTDRTLEIAKKYNCKIVIFENKGYHLVEPARTFAIQSATHDWVLVVDADEIIPEALRLYLYEQIKKADCPAGIYIPRKNYFMNKFMHCFYPDYILRFFKKEGTTWPPYIHSIPTIQGSIIKTPAKRKDLAFIHLANESIQLYINKMNQYTESERIKRKNKKYGAVSLLARPFFSFFRSYIIKGGFRDGKPGLVCALWNGYYKFIVLAKLEEDKLSEKDMDKELQSVIK